MIKKMIIKVDARMIINESTKSKSLNKKKEKKIVLKIIYNEGDNITKFENKLGKIWDYTIVEDYVYKFKIPLEFVKSIISKIRKLIKSSKLKYKLKKYRLNESVPAPTGSSNGKMVGDELTKKDEIQLLDSVIYKNMKGYVIGAIGEQVIIAIQGSTYTCDINSKDLKLLNKKPESLKPPFKFDEKTQKVLFEQYVRCGIYMGNIPIKTNNCYVKYSDWRDAKDKDKINVMVEGKLNIINRDHVQIYENVNEFADPYDYVEGVIVDEGTEEAIENVMINAEDYTVSIGDADMVRIIRNQETNPELDTIPKALLRTLSV